MARSRRLDADRLAAAYERDARRLLVFFTRRTYDAQLAVDLVGETYARAFELRRRFSGDAHDADALAAWIFGIARNVLNEALRRGAAERRALRRAGVAGAGARRRGARADRGARRARRAALGRRRRARRARRRAARRRAPARRRGARLRRRSPGRLGISEQAARARVSRGLRAIAGALDGLGSPAEATPLSARARHRRDPRRAGPRPAPRLAPPAAPLAPGRLAAQRRHRGRDARPRADRARRARRDLGARAGAAAGLRAPAGRGRAAPRRRAGLRRGRRRCAAWRGG